MKIGTTFFCTVLTLAAALSAQPQERIVEPFALNQVTLLPSQFKSNMERTCTYLLFLNTDRMLYCFRQNYGLSTKGAVPAGGWEGRTSGVILSGTSLPHSRRRMPPLVTTGTSSSGDTIVAELAICQDAASSKNYSTGYLSGFSEDDVDRALNKNAVWAPLWAIHQIFQGHIDSYNLTGNETALATATKMGDWMYNKLKNTTPSEREGIWSWTRMEHRYDNGGAATDSSVRKNP